MDSGEACRWYVSLGRKGVEALEQGAGLGFVAGQSQHVTEPADHGRGAIRDIHCPAMIKNRFLQLTLVAVAGSDANQSPIGVRFDVKQPSGGLECPFVLMREQQQK